MVLHKRTN